MDENEDPFTLRLLKAIGDLLKTITPANGYRSDLGDFSESGAMRERVFRGRSWFSDGDPLPMVSILEHPDMVEANMALDGGADQTGEWDLLIQGFVKDDRGHPTDPAHILAADVTKCLAGQTRRRGADGYPNIFGLGGVEPCVTKLKIWKPIVRPPEEGGSSKAFFWLRITLKLVEDLERPFA